VTVTDQLTTTSQITQTKEGGYFVFPEIRPGTFTLSIPQPVEVYGPQCRSAGFSPQLFAESRWRECKDSRSAEEEL
jgi:hypothetical protein